MSIALPLFALVVTVAAGYLMVKKYKPVMVLFFTGLILLIAAVIFAADFALLDEDATSGSIWFDLFGTIESIAKSQLTSVGLIIMAAGGFSTYMNKIGATRALADGVAKPIARLGKPYLVLIAAYFIGQMLFLVIPSAAGLAVLLLVTMLPVLTKAGASPAAGAAVIATVSALPMGPAAGTTVLAAETAGLSPAVYFVQHQLPVAVPAMIAIAAVHFFVQRYYDKKALETYDPAVVNAVDDSPKAPLWYSVFLLLPIILLIVFSPITNIGIELTTVSAFIGVWLLAVIVELIVRRNRKETLATGTQLFVGMGKMFGTVVSLIIAAQLFAEGLKATGLIDLLISGANSLGAGVVIVSIVFMLIVGLVTFLTGSGVGAFSAFAGLSPDVAHGLGGTITSLVTPMQFAAGLFRSMSPISAVVITVAGAVGVSPMAIVRRTAAPMIVGTIVTLIANVIFNVS